MPVLLSVIMIHHEKDEENLVNKNQIKTFLNIELERQANNQSWRSVIITWVAVHLSDHGTGSHVDVIPIIVT